MPRPRRRREYVIVFGAKEAQEGWQDLLATTRNAVAQAWENLTATPTDQWVTCHPLKGDLAWVTRDGLTHEQWQLELPGGARVWYYVTPSKDARSAGAVVLVRVSTHHPKTK